MSFVDYIEKIRSKPHQVRQRLMWVVASVVLGLIFSIWVVTLGYGIRSAFKMDKNTQLASEIIVEKAPSLLDALGASVQDFLAIFKSNTPDNDTEKNVLVKPEVTTPAPAPEPAQIFLPKN